MNRRTLFARWPFGLLLLAVLSVRTTAAAPADDLAGRWEGTSGAGGLQESWTISHDGLKWSVAGAYTRDGKEVGSFQGKDVKLAGGTLTFRQQYVKKPDASWSDGNQISAVAKGDSLNVTWKAGRQKGSVTLARAAAAPAGTATKPSANSAAGSDSAASPETAAAKKELAKLAGTWQFKEFVLDGKKIEFGATWIIKDDSILETIGLPRRSGKVQIDATKQPGEIDVNFTKSDGGGQIAKYLGVYKLDGDKLSLSLGTGGNRPTEFSSTKDSKTMLIELHRSKQ